MPRVALQAADHDAADRAGPAGLAGLDVGVLVRQDLVAGPAMGGDGDLVAHGAGGQEHRRLLAQQARRPGRTAPRRWGRSRPARRPTSAAIIASFMPRDGRVWVSE